MMTEDFLFYIWRYKLFAPEQLQTEIGEPVIVLDPGEQNTHSGPDFFNARIKIGDTIWAGNVEIHVKSSDWLIHGHQKDKAFDNVLLHVVYSYDMPLFRKDGKLIPSISLKGRFGLDLYHRYFSLVTAERGIPCTTQISDVAPIYINSWIDRMVAERMDLRIEEIFVELRLNRYDWETTFYQRLARNFGFLHNAVPFAMLAKSIPRSLLAKNKGSIVALEALLFGQAGMLEEKSTDAYESRLQKEYLFLRQKYSLSPIERHLWKFMRMRPANFPTLRIAQFAGLVHRSAHLFSKIIGTKNLEDLKGLFHLETSDYWRTHFRFGKEILARSSSFGDASENNIIVNTVVPFCLAYGVYKNDPVLKERALEFLQALPDEKNSIVDKWSDSGLKLKSAYESQGFYHLYTRYCSHKKCLSCSVGGRLVGFGHSLDGAVSVETVGQE